MNVLFLSNEGLGYVLGWQMIQEGHDVKMYIKNPEHRKGGNGFVPKVADWKIELEWADYVICDDTGWGKTLDAIRQMGIPVVGGTTLSDAMEEDRETGQKMFEALGMEILPSKQFKKIPEAIKFVSENPGKYVTKVSGKAQEDKTLTYVGQMDDGSDIGPILSHMASRKGMAIDSVQVQLCVSGVEIALGGFFNGEEFLDPVFVNFEHKKLMGSRTEQSGIGPATGEMGTVGIWKDKGFKLYNETLDLFVPVLKKTGYRGYFDINCILEFDPMAEGYYRIRPLEDTCRFGWPTIPMQIETMKINDLGELFYGIARGTNSDFKVSFPYSVCVVIGVPPLPYKHKELADQFSEDMPVLFRNPNLMDGIYPGDVYCIDDQWFVTGDMGYPIVCAAGGDDIPEAQMKVYEKVHNVVIANRMYREDIGDLVPEKIQQIKIFLEHEAPIIEEVV
jgi:phosphoribosylamine--glycine ligase